MKKLDKHTQHLFIVGVVALVAVVALVLSGSLEGAASFGKEKSDTYEEKCVDDDPGNYFDVAGTVNLGPYEYKDYCQGKELTQYYCETGKNLGATRPYTCANRCFKGACK